MAEYVIDLSGVEVKTIKEAHGIEAIEALWGLPVRERIVRCMDCRYFDEIIHACDHPCVTPLRGECPENWIFSCFEKDFCCWGKRKEVDA